MEICIRNFKCYRGVHRVFLTGPQVLITGDSGSGKSSLLQAIYFALYAEEGTAERSWTVSYLSQGSSEEGCSVLLRTSEWEVERSLKPHHLRYDDVVGEEAQRRIEARFGRVFRGVNYLPASLSFFEMGPTERLRFLSQLVCTDTESLKKRIQQRCSELGKEMDQADGSVRALRNLHPEGAVYGDDIPASSSQGDDAPKVLLRKTQSLQMKQQLFEQWRTTIHMTEAEISRLRKTLVEIQHRTRPEVLLEEYSTAQLYDHLRAMEELRKLRWTEVQDTSIEESHESMEYYRRDMALQTEIERLESQIPSTFPEMEQQYQELLTRVSQRFKCPWCNEIMGVRYDGEVCQVDPSEPVVEESESGKLRKLDKQVVQFQSLKEQVEALKQQRNVSEPLNELREQYEEWKQCWKTCLKVEPLKSRLVDATEEEIRRVIKWRGEQQPALLEASLRALEHRLVRLEDQARIDLVEDCSGTLREVEDALHRRELYRLRQQQLGELRIWKAKVDEAEQFFQDAQRRWSAMKKLKSKLKESELEYMKVFIARVERSANTFLNLFFQETACRLELGRTEASYALYTSENRERRYAHFSGGEQDRIDLALSLALSPPAILMWDEMTSQLDERTARRVVEGVKVDLKGRYVFIVAHHLPLDLLETHLRLD